MTGGFLSQLLGPPKLAVHQPRTALAKKTLPSKVFFAIVVPGTPVGSLAETQELLDFCAAKGILPDCETIRMDEINHAYERMERSDVRYRFVIDMARMG